MSDLLRNLQKIPDTITVGEILMRECDIRKLGLDNLKKALGNDLQIKAHPIEIGGFIVISKDKKLFLDRTIENILDGERKMLRSKVASLLFG